MEEERDEGFLKKCGSYRLRTLLKSRDEDALILLLFLLVMVSLLKQRVNDEWDLSNQQVLFLGELTFYITKFCHS